MTRIQGFSTSIFQGQTHRSKIVKTCKLRRWLSIDPTTSARVHRLINGLHDPKCVRLPKRRWPSQTSRDHTVRPSEYESVLRVRPHRDTFFIMDELHRRVCSRIRLKCDLIFFSKSLPNATSNQIWYRALQFVIVCYDHSYMFHCRKSFDRKVDTFLNTLHVVNSLQQKGNEHELYLNIW